MFSKLLLFTFLLIPMYLSGQSLKISMDDAAKNAFYPDEQLDGIKQNIENIISKLDSNRMVKIDGVKILGNPTLIKFYQEFNYNPVWGEDQNRRDLYDLIQGAYYEGLNPDDYHLSYLIKFTNKKVGKLFISEKDLAAVDIIMTDAVLTYVYHLMQGKVHPQRVGVEWNFNMRNIPDSIEFSLLSRLQNKSLKAGVETAKSEMPLYKNLKEWFAYYDSLEMYSIKMEEIEYPGKSLKLGDSSDIVCDLKSHLLHKEVHPDSLSDIFDAELEEALKDYQLLNGMEADGIAGKKTFRTLNIPIKTRLNSIRVNLERCRWMDKNLPDEYLLVNIANYYLYHYAKGESIYQCRVVVGKEQNETPVFQSQISYVVVNPTWTVPYSISSKEMLPRLKSDPFYLQNRNMVLLRNNKEIDPKSVDFNEYSAKYFPYTVRQGPGPRNALGRFKFIFPNEYAIYLHDTPSKSFFERTERAYSHGCVRVQNPHILAERLLSTKGYDQERINQILATEQTTNIFLKKKVPVMLMYWTCFQHTGGTNLHFSKDIYGRDKKVLKELKRSR